MARTTYDDYEDDGRTARDETSSPTKAGMAVCLATGISITLLGLALIVLRAQGFADKVDSLTALGLGPGLFLATGLMIVVAAFVLREIGHLGARVEDVFDTTDELFEMVEENAEEGATTGDERQALLRSIKTVLEEKTKGVARDAHQTLEQVANLEMELNGASESLRAISNRVDTLRRHQEEGFAALQASMTPPNPEEENERRMRERIHSDRVDALERSVQEALATVRSIESLCIPLPERVERLRDATEGKFDALISAVDDWRSAPTHSDPALEVLVERLEKLEPLVEGDADLTRAVQRELAELGEALKDAAPPSLDTSPLEAHLTALQHTCEAIQAAVQRLLAMPPPSPPAPAPSKGQTPPPAPSGSDKPAGGSAVMDSIAKLRSMRG